MVNRRIRVFKGVTLVELMVYIALIGLVFTGVYSIFNACLKYYRTAETRTVLQQNAIKVMANLFGDMVGSKSSTVIIQNDSSPKGVIFISARKSDGNYEFDTNGQQLWQRWECYYLKSTGDGRYNLIRKESFLSTPSSSPGTSPYTTVTQFAAAPLKEEMVAQNLQDISISKGTTGNFTLQITLDKTTDTTKPNRMLVSTDIHVRN